MENLGLTVPEIKELMEAFNRNKMGSLKIKQGDFSLKLEAGKVEQIITAGAPAPAQLAASLPASEAAPEEPGTPVKSPIVGTFYAAPSPEKPPYVEVGTKVKKGDVLFIIESMKLMNEVTSELDGTVTRIVVENGQPVEYGEPILYVE